MLGGADRPLRVPRSVYDGMIVHASAALPAEAVGLLGGEGRRVSCRLPLRNVLGAGRFLADPYAQFLALRQLSSEGLRPLAVYHSHPGGGIRPSGDDLRFARALPYFQVIIAIGRPHHPEVEVGAYSLTDGTLREVTLDITPE